MKIIYLHQYFNTPQMSGGTRSYEMARRLVKWGHEVHLITSMRNNIGDRKGWERTIEEGINVHWYPVQYSNKLSFGKRIKAFLKFALVSGRKALSLEGDVIFATSTPLTIALPGIYVKKRKNIPLVFEVRDLWPELPIAIGALNNPLLQKVAKALEKFAYNNSEQIIALSPGMKEGIAKTGYPTSKIFNIPNSSDINLFEVDESVGKSFRYKYEWLQDRPLIVYTGTIGVINGVSYLAELAAEVKERNPEIRFLVVGDGKQRNKVRERAKELGILNKNFFMIGRIPKNEMPSVLAAADIATSLFIDLEEMWANSANKFFDALASATPVAINYSGWQADILNGNYAGFQMHPTDIEVAAGTLIEKITDKKWLKEAGKNAKKLALSEFDRNKLAKEFETVLEKAVSSA